MTDLREEAPLLAGEDPAVGGEVVVPHSSTACDVVKEELRELKWLVLAVACFLTFGSYYIYDFPGSIGTGPGNTIETWFREHGKEYTQSMNQLLYSVYSWPNTVLAVFGGLLIDKFLGLRRAMLLFTALIFGGSLLFYAGVRSASFPLMLIGRVVFGLGGESLSVSQSAFVARWFKVGRGMALAFGITISFSRVGSSFNFIFSPLIAKNFGTNAAVLAGSAACCVSLLSCFALIAADIYAVKTGYIKPEARDAAAAAQQQQQDALPAAGDTEEDLLVSGPAQRRSLRLQERPTDAGDAPAEEGSVMQLSDILHLPAKYWLLTLICVSLYTAIFPFIGIARNFFEVKYGYTGTQAAQYLSSYQLTSAVASPVIGLVVDAVGCNTHWLIAASLAFMLVHLVFTFTMTPALILMVSMGCFYSFLVSGLWPSIPWAVAENIVGVSYGVMTAIQNIGLASFPYVVGVILDRHTPAHQEESDWSSFSTSSSSLSSSSSWVSTSSTSSHSSPWLSSESSSHSAVSSSASHVNSTRGGWSPYGGAATELRFGTGSSSSSSSSSGGNGHSTGGSTLPTMEGYFWTEMLFLGAATVSLLASVVLLVVDARGDRMLSSTSAQRKQIRAQLEEEEALLSGIIPESQRGRLDNTA